MPRHTHPRRAGGHARGHIREQRIRAIVRHQRLIRWLWGMEPHEMRRTPVRSPLNNCSCDLCTRRSWRRAERRHERQAARARITACLVEMASDA